MRKLSLYLFKNRFHVFSFFFKKRILKFKRSKWKKIKSHILYILGRLLSFKKKSKKIINVFKSFVNNIHYLIYLKKYNFRLKFLKIFQNIKYSIRKSKHFKFFFRRSILKKKYHSGKYFLKVKIFTFFIRFFFFNFGKIKKNSKMYIRSRFIFKNTLVMKFTILKYFYNSISIKYLKKYFLQSKNVEYRIKLSNLFLRIEYRIDMLFWRLKFFQNPYFVRFALYNHKINHYMNFNTLKKNILCKQILIGGDILTCTVQYNFKQNLNNYTKSFFLSSIVEVDYYTGSVALIKNLSELSFRDINSMFKEPLCVYKFMDYLLK